MKMMNKTGMLQKNSHHSSACLILPLADWYKGIKKDVPKLKDAKTSTKFIDFSIGCILHPVILYLRRNFFNILLID
ncbi:MAG: hypothetical protein CVU39_20990 [Chloroflexi bacterium HGW-Chloroflexi-10]|nr:MAG: hypothetical protein CVU39_20990 [Chloroflexi bacterium HGW-Chloroflexi-10]